MASTSAVYLAMRRQRAARLVEERVDGVSTDRDPEETTVTLESDGTWVATIADADAPDAPEPTTRLEYVTEGTTRVERAAARITRLLSRER